MNWKGIVNRSFSPDAFIDYVGGLSFPSWRPAFVVLHNTGSPTFDQWHDVSGSDRMANFQTYYRDTLGWSGGPHLFVADDLIWAFTPLHVPGVHSPSWNSMSWGVEMAGDYSQEAVDDSVMSNTISALATLHAVLGIDPATLMLHREDPKTTHACPGSAISKVDIIAAVTAELQTRFAGEHPSTMALREDQSPAAQSTSAP